MYQGSYKNILCLVPSSHVKKERGSGVNHTADFMQLISNLSD